MSRTLTSAIILSLMAFFFIPAQSVAVGGDYKTTPTTHNGKKWRIAYVQGGPYADYYNSLQATLVGLMNLGWIEEAKIPEKFEPVNTEGLWEWAGNNLKSDYLEFVSDAYWNAKRDETLYPKIRQAILQRLNEKQDIDLILALGTWSGQTLATDEHSIPTMIMSTSDPLASNIIPSVEDSGRDHIHARVDPTRHEQQVRLFHDILDFKVLGIAYEDSQEGRGFGSVDSIEKVARERGFTLKRCNAPYNSVSRDESERAVTECHEQLAPEVDAMFITRHPGVNEKNMPNLIKPLLEHKVPSFSQSGSTEVRQGVLFSISLSKFKYVGQFYARIMAKIFNGAKPRDLPQLFQSPPKIAINLATAKLISYDPPIDILGAADEIYQEISWMESPP